MRISKRQSRTLALVIVTLFFVVVGTLLSTTKSTLPQSSSTARASPQTTSSASPSTNESPTKAQLTLTNFTRSEVKDGRKLWEIHADSGEFLQDGGGILLHRPRLQLFRKEGDIVVLTSHKATVSLEGTTISKADLNGSVRIQSSEGYTVTTENATYDKPQELVVAPGLVTLEGSEITFTGVGLTAHLQDKTLALSKNVHTIITRRKR